MEGVQRRTVLVVNVFLFFVCFAVAICDLAHYIEAIFHLSLLLPVSGIFPKI